MKKVYLLLITLLAAGALSANAQQLPNNGFEGSWVDCVPWTSKNNTTAQGTTPSPWIVSNTIGTGTAGKTTVANNVTGHDSNSAVELAAKSILGKKIPGYMSLGTAWSTANGFSGNNADGGTFGGYAFTYRPDAVSFYYKRAENTTEKSTVVIYSWKGSWSQASVPANIVLSGNCTTVTMNDRDRNILGMTTSQGGTVTPSADAELIASTTHYISNTQPDWANLEIPIDYKSTSTPTKFNIIFAAGEYFESSPKTNGKAFTIDDVKLLYYSRLASLSVNGTSVAGFSSNTYNYTVDSDMPEESAFAFTCLGNSGSGKATLSLDKENAIATITVTNSNNGGTDVDGQTSHVYTITFNKPAPPAQPQLLTLTINGISISGFDPATYHYVIDSELPEESAFAFTVPDGFEAKLSLDKENAIATITVSSIASKAENSETTAVYTLQFNKTQSGGDVVIGDDLYGVYAGIVTINAIEAGLGEEDINRDGNVHIIDNGKNDGTCTFKLPDFALDDTTEGYIGDIVVENMNVTNSSESGYRITGTVNPLKLTMGGSEIVAKVTVSGTIDAAGKAVLDIDVIWLQDPENDPEGTESGTSIPVKFNGTKKADKPVYGGDIYKGTVTVDAINSGLGSENIVRAGEVHIIPDESDATKCTFVLPDFALDDSDEGYIGDIVVPGLSVTESGSIKTYTGTVNPLKLTMNGSEIIAKVTVDGTIDADGKAVMDIAVIWIMDPENDPEGTEGVSIPVKFNGQFDSVTGIEDITVDNSNAPVEYFDLRGNRLSGSNLAPGIYIRRQGTEVKKILVK